MIEGELGAVPAVFAIRGHRAAALQPGDSCEADFCQQVLGDTGRRAAQDPVTAKSL